MVYQQTPGKGLIEMNERAQRFFCLRAIVSAMGPTTGQHEKKKKNEDKRISEQDKERELKKDLVGSFTSLTTPHKTSPVSTN